MSYYLVATRPFTNPMTTKPVAPGDVISDQDNITSILASYLRGFVTKVQGSAPSTTSPVTTTPVTTTPVTTTPVITTPVTTTPVTTTPVTGTTYTADQLAALTKTLTDQVSALQAANATLAQSLTSAQNQLASAQTQNSTSSAQITLLNAQVQTLTGQVSTLSSSVTSLTAQLAAAKSASSPAAPTVSAFYTDSLASPIVRIF